MAVDRAAEADHIRLQPLGFGKECGDRHVPDATLRHQGPSTERQPAGHFPVVPPRTRLEDLDAAILRGRIQSTNAGQSTVRVSALDTAALASDLEALLTDWREWIGGHPQQARQILHKLVGGRLTFTPRMEQGVPFYEFRPACATPRG